MMIDNGDAETAFNVLRDIMAQERERRFKKCIEIFKTPSICHNTNAQPFYLWAQLAVRDIIKSPIDELFTKSRPSTVEP